MEPIFKFYNKVDAVKKMRELIKMEVTVDGLTHTLIPRIALKDAKDFVESVMAMRDIDTIKYNIANSRPKPNTVEEQQADKILEYVVLYDLGFIQAEELLHRVQHHHYEM